MDYTSRTQERRFKAGDCDNLLPMLASAIRKGTPRVRQIAQIAGMMGDTELRSLAGDADFPMTNDDRITWLIDGGYMSGFRVREWVCDCLERNNKFVAPEARDGLEFARGFALGKHSWQELFGMAQSIGAIDVPEMTTWELRNPRTPLRHTPQTYMTYAIAACLSMGNTYMKRALNLSRFAACATVKGQDRLIQTVYDQEYEHQLKMLRKHLRAEAVQWAT